MKHLLHNLTGCPQIQKQLSPGEFAKLCRQLEKSDEVLDPQSAQELLELFCLFYWQLDDLQKSCYEDVCGIWINSSREAWIKIIPQLMERSIVCNDFVFLAKILLEELTSVERKALDHLYPVNWSDDDDWTSITQEEYTYRQAKGLKCWISEYRFSSEGRIFKDYRRPSCPNDFNCFKTMLEVLWLSGQKVYFCMRGWLD